MEVKLGFFIMGKSTKVVTPPDAAAAVPSEKPSHYSLAKSCKLTWVSINPGMIIIFLKSSISIFRTILPFIY
jgi:hypothetical protein